MIFNITTTKEIESLLKRLTRVVERGSWLLTDEQRTAVNNARMILCDLQAVNYGTRGRAFDDLRTMTDKTHELKGAENENNK